jgi:hypothetical protein
MSSIESQEWGRLTVRLVKSLGLAWTVTLIKSLGQAVDTNELEWDSRVGKINSKTSKKNELVWESRVGKINSNTRTIISSCSINKWVRVRVNSGED